MAAFASMVIEANITAGWTDITADVIIDPIRVKWGINGNSAVDLIASTGTFRFTMDNNSGEYLPGLTTSVAGWDVNTAVRIVFTFEGVPYKRFRGYVSTIRNLKRRKNEDRVFVTCVDYIGLMSQAPMTGVSVAEDKRADEGITTLVSGMQTAPQATSYGTGQETFPLIFSSATPTTRIYGEAAKLAYSEFGYLYNTKDTANGETLVFEDNQNRSGVTSLSTIQLTDGSALLLETGGYLLLQTGGKLLLNKTEDAVFDNTMSKVDIQYGEDIVNYFKAIAYPTIKSGSEVQLWTKGDEPIEIGAGETVTIRGNYTDPTGGNQIAKAPGTATTAYTFRDNPNGTGTNASAFLSVSPSYDAIGVAIELTNSYTETGYVITLTFDAFSLTNYNPIFKETESSVSQAAYELRPQSITQRYQQNPDLGILKGAVVVEAEKKPRVDLQKITFNANRSTALMHAFLDLDVGSLVHIKDDDSEIDGYYYLQRIEFDVKLSPSDKPLIEFSWIVRGVRSISDGQLTPVAIEFGGDGSGDFINYGRVPYLIDVKTRSFTAWVKIDTVVGTEDSVIISMYHSTTGTVILSDGGLGQKLQFITGNLATTPGVWDADNAHPINTWFLVGVTHDVSSVATTDPIIYINGSAIAITETQSPVGAFRSEKGARLAIGGHARPVAYGGPITVNGKIADPRVYNTILSSANMSTLYNGGNPDATVLTGNGLVFQGFNIPTKNYTVDAVLAATDRLTDNMFGIVGTPAGGEIVRVFP